jgi:uncharacterized phiE125 gp8 family phage protein
MTKGSWPVQVTYTAGYASVPASIKQAMLMHTATLYAQREAVSDRPQNVVPFGLDALYDMHRAGVGI